MHDTSILDESLLGAVDDTIHHYRLLSEDAEIAVAFSGGKDSTFAALALRALGFAPRLLVVDMGYEAGWAARLQSRATAAGLELDLFTAREGSSVRLLSPRRRDDLSRRIAVLGTLTVANAVSPCTPCYNAKVVGLQHLCAERGIKTLVFGHHQTDALASMLKAALMYVDRWDLGHSAYDPSNFRGLAFQLLSELSGRSGTALTMRLREVARAGFADTDEPPRQRLTPESNSVELVRPLFDLPESVIARAIERASIVTEASGCGHTLSPNTRTPREILQFEVLPKLEGTDAWIELVDILHIGINESTGEALFASRRRRADLLGVQYRPDALGEGKI